jgi:hypothetical protein
MCGVLLVSSFFATNTLTFPLLGAMGEQLMLEKTKTNKLADLLPETYAYERTSLGNFCRLTVQGSFLIVLIPKEVVREMRIAVGQPVKMYYSANTIVFVPDPDGPFRLRKHETKGKNKTYAYPHISIPIGSDKPINVKIEGRGSAVVKHEVGDGLLILYMSERVTINAPMPEGK